MVQQWVSAGNLIDKRIRNHHHRFVIEPKGAVTFLPEVRTAGKKCRNIDEVSYLQIFNDLIRIITEDEVVKYAVYVDNQTDENEQENGGF